MASETSSSVYCVVLNWNQPEMTAECLRSLAAQDYPAFHVLLVDNGSEDDSVALLREQFPWVTFLELPQNVGYSAGNNAGIRHAIETEADYVFLLNNDTEVDPHMLTRLMEVARSDPEIGVVGPTMYCADPPGLIWGGDNEIEWRRARTIRHRFGEIDDGQQLQHGVPRQVDYIDTCAVLLKREVFEDIGLMDSRYFINFDDLDLNVRARRAGYHIVYVPSARMWHKVSATMGLASPATTYYMARNALLFFWSHAPGIWKVLAPLQVVWRNLLNVAAWTIRLRCRDESYRRRRSAKLLATRDFFLRRFGRMGRDVARACYGDDS